MWLPPQCSPVLQEMIARNGHEWLRLPGRKGLLAKLVTRQEFRADTEEPAVAGCGGGWRYGGLNQDAMVEYGWLWLIMIDYGW